ncbi:MAG: NAD(P)/FAD-dependent oxidoreductase [Desulfobulbaceae bacterium]|nr:NAD(P)/FAD-dependent oxidoreductase [Desulfobulbaceae bacterium]
MTNYDAIIIGAGPGGLACAKFLAENGAKVIVIERKRVIGPKVCAGGITWDGLIRRVPEKLVERGFPTQHVFSALQQAVITENNPIIATVDRFKLGQWMARAAIDAGAEIIVDTRVTKINSSSIEAVTGKNKNKITLFYKNLVGADGSSSIVRNYLKLPTKLVGFGINYQIPGNYENMEWHLKNDIFSYGYGWIFPHSDTLSIGAYGPRGCLPPKVFHNNLINWAADKGFDLTPHRTEAALVNFDFQGFQFNNIYLVGDAAGLASGLTGEGIYPAIISGEAAAKTILDPNYQAIEIKDMVRKQNLHYRVIRLSQQNRFLSGATMEILIGLLRIKVLRFQALEMSTA